MLAELGDALNRAVTFEEALPEALALLVDLLDLGAGWVFLSTTRHGDHHRGSFELAGASGLPPALEANGCGPLRSGGCECQSQLRRGRLDRGVNMVTCSRLATAEGERGGLERHASVPLLGRDGPVGILNLAGAGDRRFGARELAFLETVARQLGTAYERARLAAERTDAARYGAALEERRRLAQEMHDALSQLLFATDLQVRLARSGAEADRGAALERAEALLRDAQREMGALVETMRPPDLSAGLVPALKRLAQRVAGAADVHLEAGAVERRAPAPDAAGLLYRAAQEGLHNALRHADAQRVWLRLVPVGNDALELTVRDDGLGCAPEDVGAGLGLAGIRGRAQDLGGAFAFGPHADGGCELRLTVPADAAPREADADA